MCTRKHHLEDVSLYRLELKKHLDNDGHHRHSGSGAAAAAAALTTKINTLKREYRVYVLCAWIFSCVHIRISPGNSWTLHSNPVKWSIRSLTRLRPLNSWLACGGNRVCLFKLCMKIYRTDEIQRITFTMWRLVCLFFTQWKSLCSFLFSAEDEKRTQKQTERERTMEPHATVAYAENWRDLMRR